MDLITFDTALYIVGPAAIGLVCGFVGSAVGHARHDVPSGMIFNRGIIDSLGPSRAFVLLGSLLVVGGTVGVHKWNPNGSLDKMQGQAVVGSASAMIGAGAGLLLAECVRLLHRSLSTRERKHLGRHAGTGSTGAGYEGLVNNADYIYDITTTRRSNY